MINGIITPMIAKMGTKYNNILDKITFDVFLIGSMINLDVEKVFKIVHESKQCKDCRGGLLWPIILDIAI